MSHIKVDRNGKIRQTSKKTHDVSKSHHKTAETKYPGSIVSDHKLSCMGGCGKTFYKWKVNEKLSGLWKVKADAQKSKGQKVEKAEDQMDVLDTQSVKSGSSDHTIDNSIDYGKLPTDRRGHWIDPPDDRIDNLRRALGKRNIGFKEDSEALRDKIRKVQPIYSAKIYGPLEAVCPKCQAK